MLSFFPRGVLDEILNLIESVSDGFSSYSINLLLLSLSFPDPQCVSVDCCIDKERLFQSVASPTVIQTCNFYTIADRPNHLTTRIHALLNIFVILKLESFHFCAL